MYAIQYTNWFKKEHEPAHIHAVYNEYVGILDIHTFQMTDGEFGKGVAGDQL